MKQKPTESITWVQLNHGIPLLLTIAGLLVAVVLYISRIESKVDRVDDKVIRVEQAVGESKDDAESTKKTVDQLALDMVELKTALGVSRRASTSNPTSPAPQVAPAASGGQGSPSQNVTVNPPPSSNPQSPQGPQNNDEDDGPAEGLGGVLDDILKLPVEAFGIRM